MFDAFKIAQIWKHDYLVHLHLAWSPAALRWVQALQAPSAHQHRGTMCVFALQSSSWSVEQSKSETREVFSDCVSCPCYGHQKQGKYLLSCNKRKCIFTHSGGGDKAQEKNHPVIWVLVLSPTVWFCQHGLPSWHAWWCQKVTAPAARSHHAMWYVTIKLLQQREVLI